MPGWAVVAGYELHLGEERHQLALGLLDVVGQRLDGVPGHVGSEPPAVAAPPVRVCSIAQLAGQPYEASPNQDSCHWPWNGADVDSPEHKGYPSC